MRILPADLDNPDQTRDLVRLVDEYARDPMGGGQPLSDEVKERFVARARKAPGFGALLAYVGDDAVGVLTFNRTFATFTAAPVLGIHDIAVSPGHRRQGIASALIEEAEREARRLGCCKLTLEVLTGNLGAQAAYRAAGFGDYALDPEHGTALFWQKKL